jgi:hypothetical protein
MCLRRGLACSAVLLLLAVPQAAALASEVVSAGLFQRQLIGIMLNSWRAQLCDPLLLLPALSQAAALASEVVTAGLAQAQGGVRLLFVLASGVA